MIASAATNGGTKDRVHSEFKDGYVFAIRRGEDYIPVVFDIENAFGECNQAVLAANKIYHKQLMRRDGGIRIYAKRTIPVFNWSELNKVQLGTSECEGEGNPVYGFKLNRAENAAIEGMTYYTYKKYRQDRVFWNPGKTVQNANGPDDLFGVQQTDPRSCIDPTCSHDNVKCKSATWKDSWAAEVACEENC